MWWAAERGSREAGEVEAIRVIEQEDHDADRGEQGGQDCVFEEGAHGRIVLGHGARVKGVVLKIAYFWGTGCRFLLNIEADKGSAELGFSS
jgi:hypothetical protein